MRTHIITRANRAQYQSELTQMFVQRKRLFVDHLNWANMNVVEGGEQDEADLDPNIEYLTTLADGGNLVGSCRLAPTESICLLGGPLAHYLDQPLERSPTSWELTRFAPSTDPKDPRHGRSFAFLSAGVLEWALAKGITKVFGIAEPPLMAIAGGLGWRVKIEGPPIEYEAGKAAFAFSFPVDTETLQTTRKALRLQGPVVFDYFTQIEAAA
jgi:N-acyl-L-homoserine lactone synthetase